ncbi:MAG TPA: diacylglycerol kinase family protein [Cytophagales bacterium]|nr:diacylglycerol kinase family protein [Cytophagales bacterium]
MSATEKKTLKYAALVHNPTAGKEKETKEDLIAMIQSYGFECDYYSSKEDEYKKLDPKYDFIIVAGGDGTIRKMVKIMSDQKKLREIPLAILPLGTANNISKTLGIKGKIDQIIQNWHHATLKKLDLGIVTSDPVNSIIIEGMGFGMFPSLIKEMKKRNNEKELSPEKQIQLAQSIFFDMVASYEPKFARIDIGETVLSGKFYMVEIMNMRSVGPHLFMAPYAEPGDGELEVVLVPASQKDKLQAFAQSKVDKTEEVFFFDILKAKKINITWHTDYIHVDDELIEVNGTFEAAIELKAQHIQVLI